MNHPSVYDCLSRVTTTLVLSTVVVAIYPAYIKLYGVVLLCV